MIFQIIINKTFYTTLVVSQELIDRFGFNRPQNNKSKIIKNTFDKLNEANAVADFFISHERNVEIINLEKPIVFVGPYPAE